MSTPFQIIDTHCETNHKSTVVRNIAFGVYEQQLQELVADKTEENGQPPTDDELRTMKETLLSRNSLTSHVRLAEDMFAEQSKLHMKPLLKKHGSKEFWKGVGASIVANIIYSILLLVLFMVAQDQISSWLSPEPGNNVNVPADSLELPQLGEPG